MSEAVLRSAISRSPSANSEQGFLLSPLAFVRSPRAFGHFDRHCDGNARPWPVGALHEHSAELGHQRIHSARAEVFVCGSSSAASVGCDQMQMGAILEQLDFDGAGVASVSVFVREQTRSGDRFGRVIRGRPTIRRTAAVIPLWALNRPATDARGPNRPGRMLARGHTREH